MAKNRILVVDDMPINRQATALSAEILGFEVDQAASGKLAIELFKKAQYALVIMDFHMSQMNGFECAAVLRDIEKDTGRRTPIMCMSASDKPKMHQLCLEAGLDDFLTKDCRSDEFREKVLKWAQVSN